MNCKWSLSTVFKFILVTGYWLLVTSDTVWACAVCFGEGNSDLQRGFYWGILILLLLPFILILGVGAKIFSSIKKKELEQKVFADAIKQ